MSGNIGYIELGVFSEKKKEGVRTFMVSEYLRMRLLKKEQVYRFFFWGGGEEGLFFPEQVY